MMLLNFYDQLTRRLSGAGEWLAPVGIRLLLAYEFWQAGVLKFRDPGGNVSGFHEGLDFAFPFGLFPAGLNFFFVTWGELLAAIALVLGLFTRFFAFVLLAITTVAIASVHWPETWGSLGQLMEGYSVSRVVEDGEFRGNFRIPFLFLAMLMPLLFLGGGKLSLDHLLNRLTNRADPAGEAVADLNAFAIAALIFGLVAIYLIPSWGIVLLLVSAGLFVYATVRKT